MRASPAPPKKTARAFGEHGRRAGQRGEKGRAGLEFQVVGRAEDGVRGGVRVGQHDLEQLDEPPAEDRIGEIGLRFGARTDPVELRTMAGPQAAQPAETGTTSSACA